MTDLLSLSRAARLAGVSRGELQQRIRCGDLPTFEGQLRITDLLRLYPQVDLDRSATLERLNQIKADAIPRSAEDDTRLPDPEVLVARLRALSDALSHRVATVEALHGLLDTLHARLAALAATHPTPELAALCAWFDQERATIAAPPAADPRRQWFARDQLLRLMAASVKLVPSGHEFLVEGNDSILDAAVRAGLRLGYGCANGNCGACKARLLSGEVRKLRAHDYRLSERETGMGYLLACCHTAVTDLVLEAAEARSPAELPRQRIRAQIRRVEAPRPDLRLLHVQTSRAETLRFMAGQRVTLILGEGAARALPIASCPCSGRHLLFHVRRGEDDFGALAFDQTLARANVELEGPDGDFVLRESGDQPLTFVAVGDGIAPIKSLIEQAISIDTTSDYHLVWSNAAVEGHDRERWCRALAESLDNFAFTPLLDAGVADLLAILRAEVAALADPATALAARRYYLAGPAALVAHLAAELRAIGVPAAGIAVESVDLARSAAANLAPSP